MARIFVAGFESHGVEVFDTVSGATRYSTSGLDMDGSYCLECSSSTDYAHKVLPTSYGSLFFAFRLRVVGDSEVIIALYDSSGTAIATLYRNKTTQYLDFRLGTGSTSFGIASAPTVKDKTYLIEIEYTPSNSSGVVEVKQDGTSIISYSGGDTTYGLENVQGFRLGSISSGNDAYCYFDDIIVDDAAWIGKTYIQGLTITGAGTTTQWDPSTGSNYACVDEVPYSDTDYVSTNTTNEIDTYALSNLSGTIDSIKAVALTARAAYDGSPTPTHIQLGVRSGGTDYFATNFSPPSSFGFLGQRILEVDPATSAAWTESNVNAAEAGMKATA